MFVFATAMASVVSFTPLLPMMQKDAGLTLSMGAWLASANYLGYLLGALSAIWIRWSSTTMLRVALISSVVLTVAMGGTHDPTLWVALRALAGVASAWGLIFASSTILPRLAAAGAKRLSGGLRRRGIRDGASRCPCRLLEALGGLRARYGRCSARLHCVDRPRVAAHGDTIGVGRVATSAPLPRRVCPKAAVIVLCYGVFGFATLFRDICRRWRGALLPILQSSAGLGRVRAAALASTLLAARSHRCYPIAGSGPLGI